MNPPSFQWFDRQGTPARLQPLPITLQFNLMQFSPSFHQTLLHSEFRIIS
jgi:hypothetical protein